MADRLTDTCDTTELRLALVLNGGVSLAVWMGGVVHEIDRLRRGRLDGGPYGAIACALRRRVTVDLIAGSSAGGINGAALGCAIARRTSLGVGAGPLREVWLELGNIASLLRSVTDAKPESLLRGDDYMLPAMKLVFTDLLSRGEDSEMAELPPVADTATGVDHELERAVQIATAQRDCPSTVKLFLTGSMFAGRTREFADGLRTAFTIPEHRLLFSFFRDPLVTGRDDFSSSGEPAASPAWRLARAARTTASFPVAFEPSRVDPDRFHPNQLLIFEPRYVMDGGVLDNEPFDPILDQMALRPAETEVRRYIAYVVPYANREAAADPAIDPTLRDVVFAVANLPREVGIASDMDRMLSLSQRSGDDADARLRMLWSDADALTSVAGTLFPVYWATRVADALTELDQDRSRGVGAGPGGAEEGLAGSSRTVGFSDVNLAMVPASLDLPPDGEWEWGFAAAERVLQNILVDIRARLSSLNPSPNAGDTFTSIEWEPHDATWLLERRVRVGAALALVRRRRTRFEQRLADVDAAPGDPAAGNAIYDAEFSGPLRRLIDLSSDGLVAADAAGTYLVRHLCVEVIRRAQQPDLVRPVEPFQFARFSADVRNSLGIVRETLRGDPIDPAAKLAGLSLGHFGGFLKRSWRENDWLWGRIDGAEHLIRLLFDGVETVSEATRHDLATIAFPGDGAPTAFTRVLLSLWRSDGGQGETVEEARADFADFPDESLGRQKRALAARIQLDIVCSEFPILICETKYDRDDGWRADQPRLTLPNGISETAVAAARKRTGEAGSGGFTAHAQTLLTNFSENWDVSEQTVGGEAGSRAMASTASRAAAVATGALAGNRSGIPKILGSALRWLHGVALGAYGLVRSFVRSPWSGLMVAVAVATLVAVALFSSALLSTLVVPIAVGVFATGVALLLARSGRFWWLTSALLIIAANIPVAWVATLRVDGTTAIVIAAGIAVAELVLLVGAAVFNRGFVYPVVLGAFLIGGLAVWAGIDLKDNPACSTKAALVEDDSPPPTVERCARSFVDDNRWLLLLVLALDLPLIVASRSFAAAAAAGVPKPHLSDGESTPG